MTTADISSGVPSPAPIASFAYWCQYMPSRDTTVLQLYLLSSSVIDCGYQPEQNVLFFSDTAFTPGQCSSMHVLDVQANVVLPQAAAIVSCDANETHPAVPNAAAAAAPLPS